MRVMFLAAAFAVANFLCSTASAVIVPINFNGTNTTTGWTVGYNPSNTPNPPQDPLALGYTAGTVQSVTNSIPGPWVSPVSGTWINASTGGSAIGAAGWYKYSQSFDILGFPNFMVTTPFTFDVAADNHLVVTLNGATLASALLNTTTNSFGATIPVSVSAASLINGSNTLNFYVFNDEPDGPNPTGLFVGNVQGAYENNAEFVIPEPASIALWAGICGLGMVARYRRRVAK